MRKDGQGNLIFEKGEDLRDGDRGKVLDKVLSPSGQLRGMPYDGTGPDAWRKNHVARAMIDAGLNPAETVKLDRMSLASRVERFVDSSSFGVAALVIREDELDELRDTLGSNLDYDRVHDRWHNEGQNSRGAQELLGEIDALPVGAES